MSSTDRIGSTPPEPDSQLQAGWEAALLEMRHLASHLEARGANRAAVTLYDAIRIARAGGLHCTEHTAG
ncbi:MAG TPA: hypothetical protein VGQ62_12510 [Chloroflexota bacterium]|jgi:hypothetical protein|nr:hypothetical protein [Chloroflexota bacterium]